MKILICEDDQLIAMGLEAMVSEMGHTTCGIVSRSFKCLERCDERSPDVALVDLNLADGETGLELVERLTACGISSIIVSAQAHLVPDTTPAVAVLDKPTTADELREALQQVESRT